MKLFRGLLFVALCVLIICNKSCFPKTNLPKPDLQSRSGICSLFHCGKNADEVIALAKKECDNFNYKKAISLYNKSLRLNPSKPDEVYLNIGKCYILLDNYKKSIEPLSKSIEINSKNSSAYYNRGFAYYKLKDFKKSKQSLNLAIKTNNFLSPSDKKETKILLKHIEFLESAE